MVPLLNILFTFYLKKKLLEGIQGGQIVPTKYVWKTNVSPRITFFAWEVGR